MNNLCDTLVVDNVDVNDMLQLIKQNKNKIIKKNINIIFDKI